MKVLQINNYTSVLFEGGFPRKIIWNISRGFYEGKTHVFNLEHLRQDAEKYLIDCGFVPTIDKLKFLKDGSNTLVANVKLTEAVSKHRIIIIN